MLTPTTGISLSDYNAAVLNGNSIHARLVFPVQNITLTDDNISADGGIVINDILNPDTDLVMGKAVARELIVRFINSNVFTGFDWTEEFHLDFGVDISGSTKWVTVGCFKGSKPKRTVGVQIIEFTALDRMQKFDTLADEFLESIVYPATMEDIFQALCTYVGLNYTAGDENASIMAMEYAESPFVPGISCRTLLAYIAEANCCYAKITADGYVKLIWFTDQTSNYTLTEDQHFNPQIDEITAQEIDGVRISCTDEETGTSSIYPAIGSTVLYTIIDNPLLLALNATDRTTVSTNILTRFAAIGAYTPVVATVIGNWMVETGDIIEIEHDGGQSLNMPIFNRTLQWDGGCIDGYECTGSAEREELNSSARDQYEQGGKMAKKYSVVSGVDITDEGVTVSGGKFVKIDSGGIFEVNSANFRLSNITKRMETGNWTFDDYGATFVTTIDEAGVQKSVGLCIGSLKNNCDYNIDMYLTGKAGMLFRVRDDALNSEAKILFGAVGQNVSGQSAIAPAIIPFAEENFKPCLGEPLHPFIYTYFDQLNGACLVNNLTTGNLITGKALDARQGKALKDAIDAVNNKVKTPEIKSYTKSYSNLAAGDSISFTASQMGFSAPSGKSPIALARFNTGSNSVYARGVDACATGSENAITIINNSNSAKSGTVTIEVCYM